jgi:hypothetical protein
MMPKPSVGEFPMDEDYGQEHPEPTKSGTLPTVSPTPAPEPPHTENKKKFTKSYG